MPESEPPSTSLPSPPRLFRVGRDSHGNWVALDQQGLCGGLFAKRADALKFAMFENGNRPQAVIMVPDVIELDMSAAPRGQAQHRTPNSNPPLRRVA